MSEQTNTRDATDASVVRLATHGELMAIKGRYHFECFGPDGKLKWEDDIENVVMTLGKNSILDTYFGLTSIASIFMGLISSVSYASTPVAGDTLASHATWTEAGGTNAPTYTSPRKTPTFVAASGGTKNAIATPCVFPITSSGTVKGSFLVTLNSTIDNTATGVLVSAGLFTGGDKVVSNGDTLNGTYAITLT